MKTRRRELRRRYAQERRVKPRLAVYSHVLGKEEDLIAGTRKTYSGPLETGEDLMTIDIGARIETHRPKK